MWLSNAVKIAASVIAMQMRWYNPSLRDFEWRSAPDGDEEALAILKDSSRSQLCVEVYWEWRNLGAPVMVSLIRTGEAAKGADDAKQDGEVG
jgi:hypothetical protein